MRRIIEAGLMVIFWLVFGSVNGQSTGGSDVPGSRGGGSAPEKPLVRNYKIFGSKYSRVEIKDNTLKGAVFYLMSGHGGPDPEN